MGIGEALGIIGGISIYLIIWLIAEIIGYWCIFKKSGETRWKSLIPFYRNYVLYGFTWSSATYLLYWAILIVNLLITSLSHSIAAAHMSSILTLAMLGIQMEQKYRLAKCFHKGFLFTVGLVIVKPIFLMILAFDKSSYEYVETDNRFFRELKNNLVVQSEKYKEKLKEVAEEKKAREAREGTKKFAEGFCFKYERIRRGIPKNSYDTSFLP